VVSAGCSIFYTRPVQDMSNAQAAMRAAKEVQADTLAPELYRQATEQWAKAKREYKLKNFSQARDLSEQARNYAEQAEFEAVRAGGVREEPPDPMAERTSGKFPPYAYPTPTGTPADVYEQRKQQEDKDQSKAISPAPAPSGSFPATPLK
jgi:hypothetical protein